MKPGRDLAIGGFVLAIGVWFVTTGVWTVRQDEAGVVTRFGRVARVVEPGMQLTLPWPFEGMVPVNTGEVRDLSIGYRRDEADPSRTRNEAEWLTGDTNILDVRLVVLYRVEDPVAYAFRHSPGQAEFLLRKSVESVLAERVASSGVDELITEGKARLTRPILDEVRARMERYEAGIRVTSLNFESLAPPQSVSVYFADVQNARNEAETELSRADGYRRRILQQAQADATAILEEASRYREETVGEARGAADRFARMLTQYRRSPEVFRERMVLDTMKRVLARGATVHKFDGEGPAAIRIYRENR